MFLFLNLKSCINYKDVIGILRNDMIRILSHYDTDKDQRLNFDNAYQFFKDSGMNINYELNQLFGNNKYRLLTFEEIFEYLYNEFIHNIVELDKRLLEYLKFKDENETIHLKELEEIVKKDPVCCPRLASLHLIIRSNSDFRHFRYDSFKASVKVLRIFCEDTINNFKNRSMIGNPTN